MMFRLLTILVFISTLACNDKDERQVESASRFVYPKEYDSATYAKLQTELRQAIPKSFNDTTFIKIYKKTSKGLIEIRFTESQVRDKYISIPAQFNLDIQKDFLTYNFDENYLYVVHKDTIINLNISKNLFAKVADSNLKRYGILKSLVTGSDMIVTSQDSFHLKFLFHIPGTKFEQIVTIAGDSLGNYTVY